MENLRLLRLAPSGSLSAIYNKFGNFDIFFHDVIDDFSEFNIRICPCGTFNGKFWFNDKFFMYEIFSKNLFLRFVKLFFKTLVLAKKYKINVIHSNDIYFYGFVMLIISKLLNCPFCVSIHADYDKRNELQDNVIPKFSGSKTLSILLERIIYKYADKILPIRESLRDNLIKKGCETSKIRLFPHGINLDYFRFQLDIDIYSFLNLPEDSVIISSASRLERENYCYDLLEIALNCIRNNSNIYVIICGDGKEYQNMKKLIEESGYKNRISMPGFIESKFLAQLRKDSYINLVLMGGYSLIEACASGRPVISYEVEWHYELVQNNKTGYLVSENDINTVLKRIQYLLEHSKEATLLGDNAQKLAFDNFSIESSNNIKKEIYMELLNDT